MLKKIAPLFFFISSVFADPIQISSLKDLLKCESFDDQTLLVLDVDEVLITSEDHFFHPYARKEALEVIFEAMIRLKTPKEKKEFQNTIALALTLAKRRLVEESTPSLIESLQEKNIKVIALTNSPVGSFGIISELKTWRSQELKKLGMDLSSAFPDFSSESFVVSDQKKGPAFYEEGILFSSGHKKGDVLKSFLEFSGYIPSKVIFVDDLLENIESIELSLEEMNISHQSYEYTGASRFFRQTPDKSLLKKQIKHFLETQTWISDAELEE